MKKQAVKKKKVNSKLRKGDNVVVISGNYRGQTGNVLRVDNDRITVQGINIRKKHVRKTQENPQGGIVEMEKPIHISNVMVCTSEGKGVRLKSKIAENGQKTLIYLDAGEEVQLRYVKKHNN